jgi:hypothetical protein
MILLFNKKFKKELTCDQLGVHGCGSTLHQEFPLFSIGRREIEEGV